MTQPPQYPTSQEGWWQWVKAIGLQEFGDYPSANIFEAQMSWESGNYRPEVIFGPNIGRSGEKGMAQYTQPFYQSRGVNPYNPTEQVPDAARWVRKGCSILEETGV